MIFDEMRQKYMRSNEGDGVGCCRKASWEAPMGLNSCAQLGWVLEPKLDGPGGRGGWVEAGAGGRALGSRAARRS